MNKDYYLSPNSESSHVYILLHGIPGNHRVFDSMKDELERRGKKVCIPYLKNNTVEQDIAFVAALIRNQTFSDITLVVHDRGGLVGFPLLEEYGFLINHVVILNTLLEYIPPSPLFLSLSSVLYSESFIGSTTISSTLKKGGLISEDYKKVYSQNRIQIKNFFKSFSKNKKRIERNLDLLSNYGKKISIVWGKQDPYLPPIKHLRLIRDIVPALNIHTLKNGRHFIQDTHAKEILDIIKA